MIDKETMLRKIDEMPIDELRELVRKAAEESGMTYEEVLSLGWYKGCLTENMP